MLNVKCLNSPYRFAANTYIISSGDECAVVDPATPFSAECAPCRVRYILLTHAHFDHILDLSEWAMSTGAEVVITEREQPALSDSRLNCYSLFMGRDEGYFGKSRAVREGDELPFGDTVIRVMECPGHTAGSAVYVVDNTAFVGDTVFAGGGFGRWDLPTGDRTALVGSISRVMTLPEDTALYCGHGEPTTVREYKEQSKIKRII